MRRRLLIVGAAILMTVVVMVVGGLNVSQVAAQSDPDGGNCGPVPVGGSCTCNTSVVPNVVCLQPEGGAGHILVTTCTVCPAPCRGPGCNIQLCHTRTSVACV